VAEKRITKRETALQKSWKFVQMILFGRKRAKLYVEVEAREMAKEKQR